MVQERAGMNPNDCRSGWGWIQTAWDGGDGTEILFPGRPLVRRSFLKARSVEEVVANSRKCETETETGCGMNCFSFLQCYSLCFCQSKAVQRAQQNHRVRVSDGRNVDLCSLRHLGTSPV